MLSFFLLSSEVKEASEGQIEFVTALDQKIHSVLLEIRTPQRTASAIDITALGSTTVLTMIVITVAALLVFFRRNIDALVLIVVGIGAAVLTSLLKNYYSIPRPDDLLHLVDVSGHSYPSGHTLASVSIYFTLAFLFTSHLTQRIHQVLVILIFSLIILSIGMSRMYLGVHHFTDVLAGIFVGISWALLANGGKQLFK